jgi:DNA topoisomerase-2
MSQTETKKSTKEKLTKVERLAKNDKKDKETDEGDDLYYEENNKQVEVKQRTEELGYRRLQLQQQILLRPDTYIGSVKRIKSIDPIWILSNDKIVQRSVAYTEGYIRLFVEVVSNAIDNVWRSQEFKVPARFIKINIDRENNSISVWNDGKAIPLNIHSEEKIYIPELIFGNLLTSSNYNDTEERKTSGKNGYGIKLVNIFSSEFEVECFNPEYGIYNQKWEKNMEKKTEGKLDKNKSNYPKSIDDGKTGYTKITWKPELSRFDMKELDKETLSVIEKYIVDTAMTVCPYRVKVIYNEKEIVMNDHKDYVKYYFKGELPEETLVLAGKDTNAIVCPYSEFTQISFVNGINTKDGGVHVDAWCEALFRPVVNKLNGVKEETKDKDKKAAKGGKKTTVQTKEKNLNVDIRDIKKNFFIFVYASLDKPQFDNQSKTRLNNPVPEVEVKAAAISKLLKWKFIELIRETQKLKEMFGLKNETERKRGFVRVEGLDDANNAGKTGKNQQCVLCITEGLSAKTFVVQGMKYGIQGVSGRDFIGVLPIRGKFINARNASVNTLKKNKEVKGIIQSLGLQYGIDYTLEENRKRLRYGKLCLATDADDDGLHITGLLYNFFSALFPSLLKVEGFFYFMRTPILKVKTGKNVKSFYFQSEAKKYIEENNIKKNNIKYYKGLGTSNANDVKEDFGRRIVELKTDDEGEKLVDNIFSKEKGKSDFRKNWLTTFDPIHEMKSDDIKDYDVEKLDIKSFINYELINFSIEDCKRSIPCILDGFKESHRKVMFAAFKRNLRYSGEALKVAQFAGYVAEHSNYHHGETILYDTITRLAQRFVGSNNIPLLYNDGQFGTRIEMGKDAANGRYIHTKLDMLTRYIYREEDEAFLPDREDDGILVEKQYYIPIIPMILANGCLGGIGTGWSCNVPSYNINDLIEWIKLWITETENDNNNPEQLIIVDKPSLVPWYRNFKGTIELDGKKVITKGVVKKDTYKKDLSYVITELPIGKRNLGIAKYKEKLEELKEKGFIKSIKDHSTEEEPKFTVTLEEEVADDKLLEKLYLIDYLYTSNMVLFDIDGKLKKYSNINSILEEFCEERLDMYKIRKEGTIDALENELKYMRNKAKFVKEIVNKQLLLNDKDDDTINSELKKRGYDKKISEEKSSYDYLLSMQMRSMTKSKLDTLDKDIKELEIKLENYKKTTIYNMWRMELKELEDKYKEWLKKN